MPHRAPQPLSRHLRTIHFHAFCFQHNIMPIPRDPSIARPERYLLRLFQRIQDEEPANDLDASKHNPNWAYFTSAVARCRQDGFTSANLRDLLHGVRAIGGEKVAFRAKFTQFGNGDLLGKFET